MEKWLSLWSIGQYAELAAFEKIKAAGFVGVEIWAEHLRADEYLAFAKQCDLKIGLHLPFHDLNLATPDEKVKERMLEVNQNWLEKLAKYDGKHAVIHGGYAWSSEEREDALKKVKERLKTLNEVACLNHVELLLENLIPDKLNYGHIVASTLKEWSDLVQELDMKACLDTGHLAVMGDSLAETIRHFGNRLASIHYSTNDCVSDLHFIPDNDEHAMFQALSDIGYQGPIVYELNPYQYSLDDILRNEHVQALLRL
ncbi:sugar phosphate isomerase/epimerase [Virgibacillus sp. 179-BFC.A HS]|uniref:Sugar phosphate isomerase/epimerase n=1 Tax=Tigheibacillus jepli TaxID=3035914 RepID=A0ABU5CEJ8_9BACI|nr:sugar phosphate isomerase/epimerase [Virgibacillus sp. 179-BFC.A HS]MDY0404739.1 sugar phosphate isomerase/epimerase [Virgibacillus sp. 179-BFC.A HS]